MTLKDRVIRNMLSDSLVRNVNLAISFFLTPFILAKLGAELYGVWVLVFALVSYLSIFDTGIVSGYAKFVAEFEVRGERDRVSNLASTGLAFYCLLGIIVVALIFLGGETALQHVGVPASSLSSAVMALRWAGVLFVLSRVFGVFNGILSGLQLSYLVSRLTLVASFINIVVTVVALQRGAGLYGMVLASMVMYFTTAAPAVYLCFARLPGLRISTRGIDRSSLKILLRYGMQMQVQSLSVLAGRELDRILVGYLFGMEILAFYQIGYKVAEVGRNTLYPLLAALVPAISDIETRSGRDTVVQLYHKTVGLYLAAAIGIMGAVFVCAGQLLYAWIGQANFYSLVTLRVLAVAFTIDLAIGVGTAFGRGLGRPGYESISSVAFIVVKVSAALTLAHIWGYWGLAASALVASAASTALFLLLFQRLIPSTWVDRGQLFFIRPILASVPAFGFTLVVITWLPHLSRWESAGGAGVSALIYCGLYVAGLVLSGHITRADVRGVLLASKLAGTTLRLGRSA